MRGPAARGALAQNSIALVCSREPHPAPALPRESAARPAGSLARGPLARPAGLLAGDLLAFLAVKVSGLSLLSGAGAFQPYSAVDHAEVAISLWEVAARRAGDRIVPLGEEAERRGKLNQLSELALRRIEPVHADQTIHIPEAAAQESPAQIALVVATVVAPNIGAVQQPLAQRLDGRRHPRVGRRKKSEDRHLQYRRIQAVIVVRLGKGADPGIPRPCLDLGAQVRCRPFPLRDVPGVAGPLGQRDGPVERDPAPELAVGVMFALTLEFPDAVVRLAAQLPDSVGEALDNLPELGRDKAALSLIDRHAVDHGAEHIQLALAGGSVTDPNRAGAVEAGEVLEVLLGQVGVTIHSVEDLHGEVVVIGAVPNPVDEVGRLLRKPCAEQRGDAIGGIAQPAVAIVPVAIAARVFGERCRRRCAERAGGGVGQQLDHEGGSAYGVLEGPGIEALIQPPLPELASARRQLRGIAAARKLPAQREVPLAEAKREPFLTTRLEREPIDEAWPSIHLLDAALHRDRRRKNHLLRSAGGDHDAFPLGEAGAGAAVGRRRVERALHLHRAAACFDATADPLQ